MTGSTVTRSEQQFICGLEPIPSSTRPLDAGALAMEHVLASLARVEATERGGVSTVPPPDQIRTRRRAVRLNRFTRKPRV